MSKKIRRLFYTLTSNEIESIAPKRSLVKQRIVYNHRNFISNLKKFLTFLLCFNNLESHSSKQISDIQDKNGPLKDVATLKQTAKTTQSSENAKHTQEFELPLTDHSKKLQYEKFLALSCLLINNAKITSSLGIRIIYKSFESLLTPLYSLEKETVINPENYALKYCELSEKIESHLLDLKTRLESQIKNLPMLQREDRFIELYKTTALVSDLENTRLEVRKNKGFDLRDHVQNIMASMGSDPKKLEDKYKFINMLYHWRINKFKQLFNKTLQKTKLKNEAQNSKRPAKKDSKPLTEKTM